MSYEYGEYVTEDNDFNGYTTVDNLLPEWSEYVRENIRKIKIVTPDLYNTGKVCQLKSIMIGGIDQCFDVIPALRDRYREIVYSEYTRLLSNFLSNFVNQSNTRMQVADLGNEEELFYKIFESIASEHIELNVWDLWRKRR